MSMAEDGDLGPIENWANGVTVVSSTKKMALWDNPVVCAEKDCDKSYTKDARGRAAAYRTGWYVGENGKKSRCPDHLPEWMLAARARIAEGKKEL